eukprot:gene2358-4575_t
MSNPSHKWDVGSDKKMVIEDTDKDYHANMAPILSPYEAESYVECLSKFSLEEVGSSKWMEQHERIEKLNLQAHQSALTNSDEYVLEALLTFDKLGVLIHDLIIIEAWKENVYPIILDSIAGKNNMRVYFILYHEATLVNFFEVLLYHKHVCEAGGELMLELVDYSARKLARLNGAYNFRTCEPMSDTMSKHGGSAIEFAKNLESRTPQEQLARYLTEIEFRVCISTCSIARFLCEYAEVLPLSVVGRISDTHDLLMLFLPLIENPPWTRRTSDGKWEKLIDNKWENVLPIDLLKITKLEGQPWLAMYHLIAKQIFRERYHLNSFRKTQLLRVRKYINELLLDQLPVLADIQRYMDELAISEVTEPSGSGDSVFMFQQVAVMRESLLRGKDWNAIAQTQLKTVFTMTDKTDIDLRRLAELYSDDSVGDIIDPKTMSSTANGEGAGAADDEYDDI